MITSFQSNICILEELCRESETERSQMMSHLWVRAFKKVPEHFTSAVFCPATVLCVALFPGRAWAVPAAGFETAVTRGSGGALRLCCAAVQRGRNWPASPSVAQPLHPHQPHTLADRRPGRQQGSFPSKYSLK